MSKNTNSDRHRWKEEAVPEKEKSTKRIWVCHRGDCKCVKRLEPGIPYVIVIDVQDITLIGTTNEEINIKDFENCKVFKLS